MPDVLFTSHLIVQDPMLTHGMKAMATFGFYKAETRSPPLQIRHARIHYSLSHIYRPHTNQSILWKMQTACVLFCMHAREELCKRDRECLKLSNNTLRIQRKSQNCFCSESKFHFLSLFPCSHRTLLSEPGMHHNAA